MDDLIYRKQAIEALEREKTYCTIYKNGYTQTDYFKQYNMGLTDGIKALNKLQPAQPERKMGRWVDDGQYAEGHSEHAYHCSECEKQYIGFIVEFNYCPNCGARMGIENE